MRWFLLFTAVLMLSCNQITKVPGYQFATVYDFTPYTNQGFLITPYDYNGKYDAVGIISFTVAPKIEQVNIGDDENVEIEIHKEVISTEKLIDLAHKKALQMGADAIVSFKLRFTEESYYLGSKLATRVVQSVEGFAIKRK